MMRSLWIIAGLASLVLAFIATAKNDWTMVEIGLIGAVFCKLSEISEQME